ncbi:hypothetical protein ABL78_5436 [Leptomonas seymouri]|uniref:Uncharacterized protein n=1 Tax=Leptomonas seymouri TaxID=5684 RepID=A0A0N0P4N9_LEPSE|nr:hypothetical protein ABL78_5436 [Leptomonas seymouri]|eukprot:KPI85516.1 hypothetical protein ABL78_5436 [Leptomonas seymouri]
MKPNAGRPRGAPPPPPRKGGPASKELPRHRAARGAPTQNTAELTRAQQLETKAARDAVLAGAPKASPLVAKNFAEAISLDVDVDAARQLLLSSKALTALPPSIGILCRQLRKLDVSGNDLSDLSPLASLQHLSNLNVSNNPRLASLKGLSGTCLSVLNISCCAVESLVGLEHTALTLRTFIASNNRLQFQSPIFRNDSVVLHKHEGVEGMLADMDAAAEHLSASIREGVKANAIAIHNYAVFASFQQCETVVLSRNTQLVQNFPSWSSEELAVQCGEKPAHLTHDSGEESGSDSSAEESDKHRAARRDGSGSGTRDSKLGEGTMDAQTRKQLKHAMSLAHPLSVFERLPRLRKLSLSGCELHSLPSRWFLPMVTELRLAQNHLTSLQPDGVILRSLHILDISGNLFMSVITLRRCRYLEQLNVRGNPLVEEGAVKDKAAGLLSGRGETEAEGATASNAAAVPVSVQRRVAHLFPSLKLLDNQPVLSAEEMRAAYKRGREAKPQGDKGGTEDELQDALAKEKAAGGEDTKSSASLQARIPARKAPRVDPAVIAAEAEEKDVVVEPPPSVLKTAHAPIIRRERVLLRPGVSPAAQTGSSGSHATGADSKKKKDGGGGANPAAPAVFGRAAVNKLLEQSRQRSAW